jgi:hypothetical protein
MRASTRMDTIVASLPGRADKRIAESQSPSKGAISGIKDCDSEIMESQQIPTSIEADMNS